MSEGNYVTNWNSACKINDELKRHAGITNNYQYRQWLIKHGKEVAQANKLAACNECCECIKSAANAPPTQKYLFKGCADHSRPYGYENSDLKNLYLSRFALESRKIAPILTQEQYLLNRQ